MRTYNLDIQEIENKFMITIDKNQLDADYILNLLNWLQVATFETDNQKKCFNKFQQISPKKPLSSEQKHRIWNYSGSVDLNHKLDNVNLRDFAYE